MKLNYFMIALVAFLLSWSIPAMADLDQLCLKQCVSAGIGSTNCMTKCTYDSPQPASPQPAIADHYSSTNRVLGTLIQAPPSPAMLKNPVPVTAPPPQIDYTCLNQCLHDGTPYTRCETVCVKLPCDPGAVLCSTSASLVPGTLSGSTPSQAMSGMQSPHP